MARRELERARIRRRARRLRAADRPHRAYRARGAPARDLCRIRCPSRDRPCLRPQSDRGDRARRWARSSRARRRPRHHVDDHRHAGRRVRQRQGTPSRARRLRRRRCGSHGSSRAGRRRRAAAARLRAVRRRVFGRVRRCLRSARARRRRRRGLDDRAGRDRAPAPPPPATDRVHGILTRAGTTPERITDRAHGTYMVRARNLAEPRRAGIAASGAASKPARSPPVHVCASASPTNRMPRCGTITSSPSSIDETPKRSAASFRTSEVYSNGEPDRRTWGTCRRSCLRSIRRSASIRCRPRIISPNSLRTA